MCLQMATASKHPLALWLKATDMRASELARELGVSRGYITHVIHRRRAPRALLRRISERTGIDYARLRGGVA